MRAMKKVQEMCIHSRYTYNIGTVHRKMTP